MKAILSMIPQLIRASFENDMRTVEACALTIVRRLKKEEPAIAEEIAKAISYHGVGASVTRSIGIDPPPTDRDTFMSLARIDEPVLVEPRIVLNEENEELVHRFIRERTLSEKLLAAGVKPPTSLLLYGPPGVGKTYLTSLLSYKLNLPLITLDLASSISSYLGKTGQNLKKVIEYAQNIPSILFLDEFDAIAKRRDDPSDLGELKRIVNVLLKELENWPSQSIVVAATNHADMLDKAIWRRFDRAMEIGLPDFVGRTTLWSYYLGSYLNTMDDNFLKVLAKVTEGRSAADISQLSERIIRQIIVDDIEPIEAVIYQLKYVSEDNKFNSLFAKTAKELLGKKVTQKTIAKWLGISPSTLSHHLNTNKEE
ncbi:AAA family ATPase [Paenibacillus enshidis]|uniref:AAA family ATPase n=1 Tax=Paenibacillus enshidis TaxID=1458439 RepID=A0ABV5AW95_9BACL